MGKKRYHLKLPVATLRRVYMVRTTLALILVTLVFALLGGLSMLANQDALQKFQSSQLGITFAYPRDFSLSMNDTGVVLSPSLKTKSEIVFSKFGSQFMDTQQHVDLSIQRKKMPVQTRLEFTNEDGDRGERVDYDYQQKPYRIYYFVKNYTVYQLETSDPTLFSDLDTIAQSFRILD